MAEHLVECPACQAQVDAAPSPAYIGMGRPAPPHFALSAIEIEAVVLQVVERVRALEAAGGAVFLTADALAESALYRILSLASRRLTKVGMPVAPYPAARGVSILLDAPGYVDFAPSLERRAGRVTILSGWRQDWEVPPDAILVPARNPWALRSDIDRLRRTWHEGADMVRLVLLANALGVDAPAEIPELNGDAGLALPFDFVETFEGEPTAFMSCWGQYTAAFSLRRVVPAQAWDEACLHPLFSPSQQERMCRRLALRRQSHLANA